jgi:glycerol-3-phosphate cytidylyltransferase
MFKDCKEVCDKLIVGLQVNPNADREDKNKPIQSLDERYLMLKSISYIDEIVPYETEKDLYNLLLCLKPDVRIIGTDWQGKKFTGDDLPIEIHYNKRSHNYSTTNLRKRIYKAKN